MKKRKLFKRRKEQKLYSEALKRKIVEDLESGRYTTREVMESYGISYRSTVFRWVNKYGKTKPNCRTVRVEMKNEREELEDLKRALAEERLRSRVYAAQLESYEGYVPDLKKKLSTKELKKFEENERKISQFR